MERMRSTCCKRLVPVTFPVEEVLPHKQKSLEPLVASLEVWSGIQNEISACRRGVRHRLSIAIVAVRPGRL